MKFNLIFLMNYWKKKKNWETLEKKSDLNCYKVLLTNDVVKQLKEMGDKELTSKENKFTFVKTFKRKHFIGNMVKEWFLKN